MLGAEQEQLKHASLGAIREKGQRLAIRGEPPRPRRACSGRHRRQHAVLGGIHRCAGRTSEFIKYRSRHHDTRTVGSDVRLRHRVWSPKGWLMQTPHMFCDRLVFWAHRVRDRVVPSRGAAGGLP